MRAVGLMPRFQAMVDEKKRVNTGKGAWNEAVLAVIPELEAAEAEASAAAERAEAQRSELTVQTAGDLDLYRDYAWIYSNLGVSQVGLGDAPSQAAYNYLLECQANPRVREHFLNQVIARFMPTVQEMESRRRESASDEELMETIRMCREAYEAAMG